MQTYPESVFLVIVLPMVSVLTAASNNDFQLFVDEVYTATNRFGLRVGIRPTKTEMQCISRESRGMKIVLENSVLVQCNHFVYLGGSSLRI